VRQKMGIEKDIEAETCDRNGEQKMVELNKG
jgi:hypothetical protein